MSDAKARFHFRPVPILVAVLLTFGLPYVAQEVVDTARHYSHLVPGFADRLGWLTAHHTVLLILGLISIGIAKLIVPADYGLDLQDERSYVAVAFLWGIIFGVLLTLVEVGPSLLAHVAPKLDPSQTENIPGWLAFNGLYVGLAEEIPFRALVVTYLAATMPGSWRIGRYSMNAAGVVAALIYAIWAAGFLTAPLLVSLAQFVCQFLLGVLYAYWLEKSKSVIAPIVGHNVSSLTQYGLMLGLVMLLS
ncbi:MAG TPA: CPBP family intramembrane glutamic endopeptidase [Rhizomicrobium sp.]|nr:CPBP family intramembrane glutamic endopeptidase [Rhizomicrobium sp.]